MKCKKCTRELEENAKFCSYCGEKVDENSLEEKKDYIDPFEQYRTNNSHEGQFEYQQNYSDKNEPKEPITKLEKEGLFSKNNYSLIGIILAILAIFGCIGKVAIGIVLMILSLILIIKGYKHAKTGMRVASIITAILSTILVIALSILMWIFTWEISFVNGMKFTIKEYAISSFYNGYHSDKVYGMWQTNSGEILDLTAGFSYTIYDKEGKEQLEGEFNKVDGYEIAVNDFIYSDKDYYFYELRESEKKLTKDTKIVLCLDKRDFNKMAIYMPKKEIIIETQRVNSLSSTKDNYNDYIDDDYNEIIG